jgi:hypothetical protein
MTDIFAEGLQQDRLEQYQKHISSIFKADDTICFVAIEHNEDRSKEKVINSFASVEDALKPEYFEMLQRLNDAPSTVEGNSKPSIYLAMNAYPAELIGKRTGRTQDNVVAIKALYADVDKDGKSTMQSIDNSAAVPEPSIVLETSPGKYQGIWPVDGIEKAEAKPLLQAIAQQFHTDSAVAETARVLRVPGLRNHKYATAPEVLVIRNSGVRHDRAAFKVAVKPVTQKTDIPRDERQLVPKGHRYYAIISYAGKLRNLGNCVDDVIEGTLRWAHTNIAPPFNDNDVRQYAREIAEGLDQGQPNGGELTLNQAAAQPAFAELVTPAALKTDGESWIKQHVPKARQLSDKPVKWLVDKMLLEHGLHLFSGKPGAMKTMLAIMLSRAVATGETFMDRANMSVDIPVVYVDKENPEAEVRRRCRALGLLDLDNFYIWGDWDADNPPPASMDDPRLIECARRDGAFFIFDSLSSYLNGSEENSSTDMMLLMTKARQLARSCAGVIILHHQAKNGPDASRGSGSILASTDMAFIVKKKDNVVTVSDERFRMCEGYTVEFEMNFDGGLSGVYSYRVINNGLGKKVSGLSETAKDRLAENQADFDYLERAKQAILAAWQQGSPVTQGQLATLIGLTNNRTKSRLLNGGPDKPWHCVSASRGSTLFYPKQAVGLDGKVTEYSRKN